MLALLALWGLVAGAHGATVRATADSSRSTAASWAATLTVEAYFVDNGDISFWTRAYCYEGECSYPGPVIEVVPGDNFTLTLVNELGPNAEETHERNSMGLSNSTNLHTHGVHLSPGTDSIFATAAPGETLVYAYEVPANHAPGTHWYHDHTHGGSALRVMGGLCGALIVRPAGDENLPASITEADEHIIVITPMNVGQLKDSDGFVTQGCSNGATCDPATQPPDCTADNAADSTTFDPFRQYSFAELSAATGSAMDATVTLANVGDEVTDGSWVYNKNEISALFTNGQWEPTVEVAADQAVTLRIVHAGGGEELKLEMAGNCEMQTIAWDGVYLDAVQTRTTLYLMAGARVDIQVTCAGSGELKAASAKSDAKVVKFETTGSGTYALTTTAELAAITRPYYLADLTGDDVVVDTVNANHVSQGNRPTAECGGSDLFWWGAGPDCSMVAPWGDEQPSSTNEECMFGFFGGERGNSVEAYEAAHKHVTYLGNGTDGEVNEWSLYGLGNSKHPLHLHVHHMQVVSYECVEGSTACTTEDMDAWLSVGEWRDVLPTFEGVLRVRFRATDFAGETVLHCHFLRHEDLGMMDTILVVDGYRPVDGSGSDDDGPETDDDGAADDDDDAADDDDDEISSGSHPSASLALGLAAVAAFLLSH